MRPADETVDLALRWLADHADQKFFVWLHLYDPHLPYVPPDKYGLKFNPEFETYKRSIGAEQRFSDDAGPTAPPPRGPQAPPEA